MSVRLQFLYLFVAGIGMFWLGSLFNGHFRQKERHPFNVKQCVFEGLIVVGIMVFAMLFFAYNKNIEAILNSAVTYCGAE